MKVRLKVEFIKSYSAVYEDSVAVEVEDIENYDDIYIALGVLNDLVIKQNFLNPTLNRAVKMFYANKVSEAKADGIKEGKADNSADYTVRRERDEAMQALKRKECQLDGLIKGINPEFVPTVDENNPKEL